MGYGHSGLEDDIPLHDLIGAAEAVEADLLESMEKVRPASASASASQVTVCYSPQQQQQQQHGQQVTETAAPISCSVVNSGAASPISRGGSAQSAVKATQEQSRYVFKYDVTNDNFCLHVETDA